MKAAWPIYTATSAKYSFSLLIKHLLLNQNYTCRATMMVELLMRFYLSNCLNWRSDIITLKKLYYIMLTKVEP